MRLLQVFIILTLIFGYQAQARPWPGTFSTQTYHTFYTESRVVDSMPFAINGFSYQQGKPAILNFITAYVQLGTHPQNLLNPPRYMPPFTCRFGGNIPVYDGWTFIIATTSDQIRSCR